jgi:hypothetical protein
MVNVLFIMHSTFHVLVGTLAMAYVSFKTNLVLTTVYIPSKIYLTLAMVYISIRINLVPCVLFQTLVTIYIFIKICMAIAMVYFPFETRLTLAMINIFVRMHLSHNNIFDVFFLKHKLKSKLCLLHNKKYFSLQSNVIAQDYP